jgi:putative tryptophan/tyrosine transport system substrate-binding protein
VNTVIRRLFALAAAGVVLGGLAPNCLAKTVVIVCSDSLTSTTRSISGARSEIRSVHPEVEFVIVQLRAEATAVTAQLDSIRAAKPALILTVGSAATQTAKDNFPTIPIVFSSVMYPVISGFVSSLSSPGEMITGASLDVPVNIQFDKYRQIVPKIKRIGVLYTSNTAKLIPPAKAVAQEMGLELVAIEIASQRDLPGALDSLARIVDGLWSVADYNLFDPQSTKYILLNTIRRGLPFMGFSRYVVESGALFAIDFDYKGIGKQAGRIANQILDGARPGSIAVSTPDILWFHYNEATANHVKVTIPPELVAIAKEVYR